MELGETCIKVHDYTGAITVPLKPPCAALPPRCHTTQRVAVRWQAFTKCIQHAEHVPSYTLARGRCYFDGLRDYWAVTY